MRVLPWLMVGMLFSIPVANMKLAMTQSPSSSAGKGNILNPPHTRYDHKQPPGIWLHFDRLLIEADACRRNVKPVERNAAERATGRTCHRHLDHLEQLASRREAP